MDMCCGCVSVKQTKPLAGIERQRARAYYVKMELINN